MPDDCVGLLVVRSGLSKIDGVVIPNGLGIIDSDYRGEYMLRLYCMTDTAKTELLKAYKIGDRIAQVVFVKLHPGDLAFTDVLSNTNRGSGGFGSTGV